VSISWKRYPNEGKYITICYKIREVYRDKLGREIDTLVRQIDTIGRD